MSQEKKQSEIEKALRLAFENYKSSLESILNAKPLSISIEIGGVKLSTLAKIVEEGEDIDLNVIENCGMTATDTRFYINIDSITLEHLKSE